MSQSRGGGSQEGMENGLGPEQMGIWGQQKMGENLKNYGRLGNARVRIKAQSKVDTQHEGALASVRGSKRQEGVVMQSPECHGS